ncbi:MAG: site-specific integrase [Microthrixaceae bacterium]|nr:site-specific integrase [Microthrixaceae bacterium]
MSATPPSAVGTASPDPRSSTVVAWAEQVSALPMEAEGFLTHLSVERGRSPLTISAYRRDLLVLCGFLGNRGNHDAASRFR